MNDTDRQLMRLLHGELAADRARELEDRLARDGELVARYRRLAAAWQDLEPPPAAAIGGGFTARVMAAARRRAAAGELSWSLAPAWARVASVAALAAGLVLGASFGVGSSGPEAADPETYALSEPLSLAESFYLSALEADDGLPAADDNGEERVQ